MFNVLRDTKNAASIILHRIIVCYVCPNVKENNERRK